MLICLFASSISIPKSQREAPSYPTWRQAMIDEICTLQSSGTWDLVPLPQGKSVVGCRWIYTVKVGLDGNIGKHLGYYFRKEKVDCKLGIHYI